MSSGKNLPLTDETAKSEHSNRPRENRSAAGIMIFTVFEIRPLSYA